MKNESFHVLDEFQGKKLLKEFGIPVVEEILADGGAQAFEAAHALGYPVVLKVCSEAVLHKTEKGGVVLNIPDEKSLAAAVADLETKFAAVPHSLLVQKMAGKGVELILGARHDPVFGPVVLAGLGGIFAEMIRDTSLELAPLTHDTALSMLKRLKGFPLLNGYRGRPPVEIEIVADAMVSLSRLVLERKDIIEIDINPLIAGKDGAVAVDALVRLGEEPAESLKKHYYSMTVDPFFNPRSVALIGASRNHLKGGNIILKNIIKAGFKGKIYPINPSGGEILNLKTYKSVKEAPGPVDLAMIVIPKTSVPQAIDDCIEKKVPAVILSTGGYSDIGESGAFEQKELQKKAENADLRLMGPNSIGTINPSSGLATSIVGLEPILPGGVSLIGQSGVFSSGWGRWISEVKPFGISKIACMGNKGDINESDLLEYLAGDSCTTTIGMYLEGVLDGDRFIKAAARASRKKPVVVMKSGKTEAGAKAVASHTGSLAGSDDVFEAVCRLTGMVRVHDSESFFDVLSAFESLPLPKNNRMGVLSISGMGCVVSTDVCQEYGVALPDLTPATLKRMREVIPDWAPLRNPVDIWSAVEQHGSSKTMSHLAECMLEQDDIDAVHIIFVLMPESIFDIGEAFAEIVKKYPHKPVLVSYFGGTEKEIKHTHQGFMKLGIPSYPTPERAIYAFSRMVEYAKFMGKCG